MGSRLFNAEMRDLKRQAHKTEVAARNAFTREGDPGQYRILAHDAVDLAAIYLALSLGNWSYAKKVAGNMETAARDEIPGDLYTMIMSGCELNEDELGEASKKWRVHGR